jgi:hypothetical protein
MKLEKIRTKVEIVAIFLFKAKRTSKFQFYLFLILVEACKEYRNEIHIFKIIFIQIIVTIVFVFLKHPMNGFAVLGKKMVWWDFKSKDRSTRMIPSFLLLLARAKFLKNCEGFYVCKRKTNKY